MMKAVQARRAARKFGKLLYLSSISLQNVPKLSSSTKFNKIKLSICYKYAIRNFLKENRKKYNQLMDKCIVLEDNHFIPKLHSI